MVERIVLGAIGIPLAISGMGLTLSFGVFVFLGMPLLILGLGFISAAVA